MSEKPRILVLNKTCLEVFDHHREWMAAQEDVEILPDPAGGDLKPEDTPACFEGAAVVVLPGVSVLPEHMESMRALKVISLASSGFESVDVEAATRCGIVVTNALVREGAEVVADMALALMLAVAREIPYHHQQIVIGEPIRGMGTCLWSKTLGIVGLGNIGKGVARRAAGFDMRVLATEPFPDHAFVQERNIELVPLDELLDRADFVSLHVRLNADTDGMIGARELALMKPTAFLVNTARKKLVNEDALEEAVLTGIIAGAALDDPPTANSPLLQLPNFIATTHLGNRAIEGVHAVFRGALENALAVLRGQRPQSVVNPEVYDGMLR